MTKTSALVICPRCKGDGKTWQSWNKSFTICVRCDGNGLIAPRDESYRDFRKRVIEGKRIHSDDSRRKLLFRVKNQARSNGSAHSSLRTASVSSPHSS